jgi:FixJ family two-component response regulator
MKANAPTVVYVVDDDDSMRVALGRVLAAAGYLVRPEQPRNPRRC